MEERIIEDDVVDNCLELDAGLKTIQAALRHLEMDKDQPNICEYLLSNLIKLNWENHDKATERRSIERARRELGK